MLSRRSLVAIAASSSLFSSARACPSRPFYLAMASSPLKPALRVRALPLFEDNYAWEVLDQVRNLSFLVDPANHEATKAQLAEGSEVGAVLFTHRHWDHAGDSAVWASTKVPMIAAGSIDAEKIEGVNKKLEDGEVFEALPGVKVKAIHTPFHTQGSTCFFVEDDGEGRPMVFTGDTLFSAGCGRFFEGTPEQAFASLAKLKALPPSTLVFCGHEYTAANLKFCLHVEPDNADTKKRAAEVAEMREKGKPSVPVTMATELATNVFLRTDQEAVRRFAAVTLGRDAADLSEVEILGCLREAKNSFKG